MKRPRIETSVQPVRRVHSNLTTERPTSSTSITSGVVRTPMGIVEAHSYGSPANARSWLEIVIAGKVYRWSDNRYHSRVALARLAARFARDVAAGRVSS